MGGFTLYGTVETSDVAFAVNEALERLRSGQAELAVHPRCGTVLATTGLMTGLAAFMTTSIVSRTRARFRWATIPETILAATFAAIAAQPIGLLLQEQFTVSGEPGNLSVQSVTRSPNKNMVIHRVATAQ
jgi:hypothetical protein